ncbi:hypothetical protein JIN84_03615 [Luteolibacter yonseiensis]|uniref:DOMON-like domain-containing protein n=1 Tax=Luteolibacter yonseiensis TaxID=1144680 RepID=A0A934VA12_9BACT|nr:hypothetical protein [Luteolibacter yonseiensis]MBK1814685.1 hypothetical protein [Luteolibacter yonseiensis]
MTIFTSPEPLVWGELDVPLFGLGADMAGVALQPPVAFSLVSDGRYLWFLANHRKPANVHPKARPGLFQSELWKYDVAELFLADPASGRYFEFNLAPNGAWWTCEFTAPRVRADEVDIAMPEVATFSDMSPDGSWLAAMAIPLDLLKARLDFGPATRLNVSMILGSPEQRFVSATDLGPGEPDFHQPRKFSEVRFSPLPENP